MRTFLHVSSTGSVAAAFMKAPTTVAATPAYTACSTNRTVTFSTAGACNM